ncbi:PepSY domain-containing protein [Ornithinibacillus sp. 179-J 7C1 HS]|uniref:PepSY domain-containing protein n=1 Tax=Ornithinibacillus sp. 179-J 7C1 HS TaxID=3142384 RepID=UPI0039A158FA
MKKKVIMTVSSVAIATVLGLGIYHSNAAQAEPKLSRGEIEALVTSQYPGTITEMELEKGFNKVIYEVEVESDGMEYEIKLDGNTGEVIKIEQRELRASAEGSTNVAVSEKNNTSSDDSGAKTDDKNESTDKTNDDTTVPKEDDGTDDKDKEKVAVQPDERNTEKNANEKKTAIDSEAAMEIALAEFEGTIKELDLDEDDGRLIYEIEIKGTAGEAELDIDAYTGEIISISIDTELGTSIDDNDDDDDDDDD